MIGSVCCETKNKKSMIIGGLLAIVLLMTVGYAALSTSLNIGATTNISSTWDIYINDIMATKVGSAEDTTYTHDKLSATFAAQLEKPGDSITYNIEVKNDGNIDAYLQEINKNITISNFDTSSVTNMSYMFYGCSGLKKLDVTSFDTSNVTNMGYMFYSCSDLKIIYVSNNFVTTNATNHSYMFYSCNKLVGGNGTTFDSSHVDKTYAVIDDVGTPGYFTDIADKPSS